MPNLGQGTSNRDQVNKEDNTQPQGRQGSQTQIRVGPAARRGVLAGNPTDTGGINRGTRGKQGKSPGALS